MVIVSFSPKYARKTVPSARLLNQINEIRQTSLSIYSSFVTST